MHLTIFPTHSRWLKMRHTTDFHLTLSLSLSLSPIILVRLAHSEVFTSQDCGSTAVAVSCCTLRSPHCALEFVVAVSLSSDRRFSVSPLRSVWIKSAPRASFQWQWSGRTIGRQSDITCNSCKLPRPAAPMAEHHLRCCVFYETSVCQAGISSICEM